jgi:hypothetical protein
MVLGVDASVFSLLGGGRELVRVCAEEAGDLNLHLAAGFFADARA